MRRFKIQSSPGRFFSFASSFRPSREDDRKTPHFRVVFLASIVVGTRGKGESTRSIQRDLKAGRSLPKRQPEKRFSLCSLFRSFVSVREKKEREKEEEELLRFRVGRALRDESGAQLPSSSSSSSETTRLLTAFFQKNRARKEGKNRPKIKTYRALSW